MAFLRDDDLANLLAWHYEELYRHPRASDWMVRMAQRTAPYHLRGREGRMRFFDRYWRRDWWAPGWGFDYEGQLRFYAPALLRKGVGIEFNDPPDYLELLDLYDRGGP